MVTAILNVIDSGLGRCYWFENDAETFASAFFFYDSADKWNSDAGI